jgi:AraC-like DNA-binding protein
MPSYKTSPVPTITPLLKVLAQKFIPQIMTEGKCFPVIARPSLQELNLSDGVSAEYRKPSGRRVALKHPQTFDRMRQHMAHWPKDGMREARVPKFALVAGGRADLRVGDYMLHCPVGTIIFFPPGTPHPDGRAPHLEGEARQDGHCDIMWITPMGGGVDFWMCHSQGEHHTPSNEGEKVFLPSSRIHHYITAFDEEVASHESPDETILRSLIRILLVSIHRDLQNRDFLPQGMVPEQEPQELGIDVIEQAKQYIQAHLAEPLTLDLLARKLCMSRSQFAKRFRLQTGQSVNEYINECRLERAKRLLSETDWPMAVIIQNLGFRSVTYFHQFFRTRTEMSPVAYRKHVRQ